jgi:hypothetical protein
VPKEGVDGDGWKGRWWQILQSVSSQGMRLDFIPRAEEKLLGF